MGVVPPRAGLQRRAAPDHLPEHGALLVFDEVMTGFRVSPGRLVRAWRGSRPDLFTFGKVMGGGLPGGGLRRPGRRHGAAGPGRAGLPGRHPVREPGGHRGRADHAAAGHRRGLRPPRRRRRAGRRARLGRADRGRGGAPRAVGRQHVLASSSPTPQVRDYATARSAQEPSATPRSSTRCWPAGSTCRRRRSRPGSSRRRTTSRRWSGSPRPCRRRSGRGGGAARTAGRCRRGGRRVSDQPTHRGPPAAPRRGAQPRGGAVRPAARLPPVRAAGGRWPTGSPSELARPRHRARGAPPRWSGPRRRRPRWPRRSACRPAPTSG